MIHWLDLSRTPWFARISSSLLTDSGVVLVNAKFSSGLELYFSHARFLTPRVAWVYLEQVQQGRDVSVAQDVLRSFCRTLRLEIEFDRLENAQALDHLEHLVATFPGIKLVVFAPERAIDGIAEVCRRLSDSARVVLVQLAQEPSCLRDVLDPALCLLDEDLLVFPGELSVTGQRTVVNGQRDSNGPSSAGPLLEILNAQRGAAGVGSVSVVGPQGLMGRDGRVVKGINRAAVQALVHAGQYAEAFEVAVEIEPALAPELVSAAYQEYAERNDFARLFNVIQSLPIPVRQGSDVLLRIFLEAAIATRAVSEVVPEVRTALGIRDAPELRAVYLSLVLDGVVAEQAKRALLGSETPLTLRMVAHHLGVVGEHHESSELAQRALRLAQASGDGRQIIAATVDLASSLVRLGSYRGAMEWARWALDLAPSTQGLDSLLLLHAEAVFTYCRALASNVTGTKETAEKLRAIERHLGLPTSEAAVSTLGDLAVLDDDLEEARRHYQNTMHEQPQSGIAFAAVDLVAVLVALGEDAEARVHAERVRGLTDNLTGPVRSIGLLVHAIATNRPDFNLERVQALRKVLDYMVAHGEAPRLAQTALHLGDEYLKRGDGDMARRALLEAHRGTRELSETGWQLLSLGCRNRDKLLALGTSLFRASSVELRFMNGARVHFGEKVSQLGRLQAECLFLIALSRSGISLGALVHKLSGAGAVNEKTVKATISRLRQLVPISRSPYMIDTDFQVDFLEVAERLRQGQLRDALALYRGDVLPESENSAVVEVREQLHEALRQAVIDSGDVGLMVDFADVTALQDLELLELAVNLSQRGGPLSHYLSVRIEQLRRDWGLQRGV